MEEDIKILEELLKEYKGSGRINYFVDLDDLQAIKNLIAKNKELERQNKIKDEYLKLICDIAYDYDGCNTTKSLKELIDELVEISKKAITNDDTSVMYIDCSGKHEKNILQEFLD